MITLDYMGTARRLKVAPELPKSQTIRVSVATAKLVHALAIWDGYPRAEDFTIEVMQPLFDGWLKERVAGGLKKAPAKPADFETKTLKVGRDVARLIYTLSKFNGMSPAEFLEVEFNPVAQQWLTERIVQK